MEQGEGLGRAALRGLDPALGHPAFLDLVQRLTGAAVQNIEIALLGRQDHRRHAAGHVHQGRLRTQVIVPDVLAHRLEMPARLARRHVQGHQRGRVFVLGRATQTGIIVRRRVAHGQEDQTQGLVGRGRGPHVRRAGGIGLPLRRQGRDVGPHHVPGEAQLPRHGVEALDDAGRVPALLPVQDLMPCHHHAAHDDRGRGDGDHAGIGVAHPRLDADRAIGPEAGAGRPRSGVHGDQPAVQRPLDDARGAGLGRIDIGLGVIGHAPAGGGIGNLVVGDLGIIGPLLLAGRRIQGEQPIAGRAQIEGVADLQRRGFGPEPLLRQVPGAEGPGALQALHIVLVDLVQRRIALGAVGPAIGRPVGPCLDQGRIADPALPRRRHRALHPRGEGQDDQDQQHQGRDDPRHQGPAVQPHLPQGPDDRADEDEDIEPGARHPQQGQQPPGQDHQQADDQIIGRAAQHDQLPAADGQRQPDQGDDHPKQSHQDASKSAPAFNGGHIARLLENSFGGQLGLATTPPKPSRSRMRRESDQRKRATPRRRPFCRSEPIGQLTGRPSVSTTCTSPRLRARILGSMVARSPTTTQVVGPSPTMARAATEARCGVVPFTEAA